MSDKKRKIILRKINSPEDLKSLNIEDLKILSTELERINRDCIKNWWPFRSWFRCVELTVALHFVFNSPKDKLIWDVGHQAYP